MGKPLVGWASHRFNLAVKQIMNKEQNLLSKINTLMLKLRTLLMSDKLQQHTTIRPLLRNETRWSSSFEMCKRYVEIRDYLSSLDSAEMDDMSLTVSANRKLDSLLICLNDLESVANSLEHDSTTLCNMRALFDAVIDDFPQTVNRVSVNAGIVFSSAFESAAVKLQIDNVSGFSRKERNSLHTLKNSTDAECVERYFQIFFVQCVLNLQKLMLEVSEEKYIDTRFILPRSHVCERLFSTVGYGLTERQNRLTPTNLESQIFLHASSDQKMSINCYYVEILSVLSRYIYLCVWSISILYLFADKTKIL